MTDETSTKTTTPDPDPIEVRTLGTWEVAIDSGDLSHARDALLDDLQLHRLDYQESLDEIDAEYGHIVDVCEHIIIFTKALRAHQTVLNAHFQRERDMAKKGASDPGAGTGHDGANGRRP